MYIKFKHIYIENFMSIEQGSLELNNQGYVLINGINNNPTDASNSNGSGKSSIIEAVVYALTGETIRGTKDIVNAIHDKNRLEKEYGGYLIYIISTDNDLVFKEIKKYSK